MQSVLPLVLCEECAVLIPWQRHCHACAVELTQTVEGWFAAAHYLRTGAAAGFNGCFDVMRGPYCAREAALRNAIAFLVRHMLHMGLTEGEAVRIYRAAGMPILPRWPGIETEGRADA